MPGPSKRPTVLKLLSGTARRDRDPVVAIELPPVTAIPNPPDWLPNAHAVSEWQRLAPMLVANRLLAAADLATFGHLCAVHGKLVALWAAGEAPSGHLLAQYRGLAGAFGLSPAWRSRVTPAAGKRRANPFHEIMKIR